MTIKHRVVVAGCGGMSRAWIEYALNRLDVEIVALVDIKIEYAQAMAEKQGLHCRLFDNIEKAIKETGANLVFDVTIPASHFQIATAAMELGCNVFGEKPLAETMEQCNGIVALSDQSGKSHAVMQNRRFDSRIRSLQQLIRSGTIGKPGYIGAEFFLGPHFGGFRDVMDSPLLLDMAIHTFDAARLIIGADPVSVYCHEFNPPGSWYKGNAAAICIFEMSNGSVFCYQGSWCSEGVPTSWESSWRISGEKGTAIWDGQGNPYAEVVSDIDQTGNFTRDFTRIEGEIIELESTFHQGCLDEMFQSLEENRPAETDCRDNRQSMAMVLGAIESVKLGKKIDIKEFFSI